VRDSIDLEEDMMKTMLLLRWRAPERKPLLRSFGLVADLNGHCGVMAAGQIFLLWLLFCYDVKRQGNPPDRGNWGVEAGTRRRRGTRC